MNKTDKIKKIEMLLDCELSNDSLVAIHNKYCELINNPDDHIYHMYEIEDLFQDKSVIEVIDSSKTIDINDEFLCETIYGWSSFTDYCDCVLACSEDIAKYCVRHNYDFGNWEIEQILEEEENGEY